MAGFRRKRKVYKLDFSGTDYDGLEVTVRGLTTGEYLQIVQLTGTTEEGDKETEGIIKMFASHLVAWNLEDEDGMPVATSYEAVQANDFLMNMAIVNAWTSAIASVPEDTAKKSAGTTDSLVASIPTEML